jgi:putative DNA methylase
MKTEIDQAHFLIGAALPGSGVHLEEELSKNSWFVRRSVEAVLDWYAKTAAEPEVRAAAVLAGSLLRRSIEQRRRQRSEEQGSLFDEDEFDT